jgi:hypothetical protein
MECRPLQKKWAALPRGPVSSWVWANNAVNGAPGTWVSISSMERRANTMGSASAWARFSMGFGRRRRERLGVAIVFLALAPFAPAAGPSRTKSSSPSSPLRTFSMDAAKGNPLLGGALGFPPVSAGSSCRAFVRSLARAFIRAAICSWPAWRLAPPRRWRRVSPTLMVLLAHALSCSRSCHSCAAAVAELSLQPLPPSRSPCKHVAVAPSRSRCHRYLAGNRHASAPRAVPRLVGLSWGVVAACTRLAPYSSAFPAALGSAPLSTSSSASSLAPLSESSSQGGDVIVLGIIHRRCERRLVNSRASGHLRRARRPPPRALMGIVVGFVVVGKRCHPPRRHRPRT